MKPETRRYRRSFRSGTHQLRNGWQPRRCEPEAPTHPNSVTRASPSSSHGAFACTEKRGRDRELSSRQVAPDDGAPHRASRLGLSRVKLHLRFISTEELVALYRVTDIVVYPYRAITTSGALATGLALGKTIVASNLPVFRELLTDRENALLVDPNNSAELADALIKLSSDSQLRLQLAANVLAMHFGDESWLSIANRTKNFYAAILR